MGDYKKSKEHLTNAALASPLAFLAGGPVGAAMVLGLGVLEDRLEDRDFEKRQAELENNPHRPLNLTLEQVMEKSNVDADWKEKVNDLPQIKNAKEIRGCSNYRKGYENDLYITVYGGERIIYNRIGVGDGEIIFHVDRYDLMGSKRVPAKLYRDPRDFYDKIVSDSKYNKQNMYVYKIIASGYQKGSWMYTMDGGKSYVVGL